MIHNDAWLAGIYEGEGNLYLRPDGCWQVTISMKDRDVVERVMEVAGCGHVTLRKHSRYGDGWSDQYAWRVGRRADIAALLRRIRPYLR